MLKSMFIESMNQPITNWLNLNYVSCKDSSIPRCIIYQHYCEDFKKEGIEPLNTAMFGKVIKMAFPFIRSRRLGNRGNSKYHYFGVAARGSPNTIQEDSMSEKIFIKKYQSIHKDALEKLLEGAYIQAYQELKRFWAESIGGVISSKGMEKICTAVEKEFFLSIIKQTFGTENILHLCGKLADESINSVKIITKTIIVLCRQISSITHSKGVLSRMDTYKQYSITTNYLCNVLKHSNILEKRHSERLKLEEFIGLMGSAGSMFQESIPIEKSNTIHMSIVSLVSLYITSKTFPDFVSGVEESMINLLYKKDKVSHNEIYLYFSGLVQEISSSTLPCIDISIILCSFFCEYYCVITSSLYEHTPQKTESMQEYKQPGTDQKSFVSQIITEC
ncbi:hypothetical protein NEOKW01_1180 [Nematocida sp. AWRm80]|nr:hypothetical protein NEOKW01_1180 [Nematocida sp. AWRm80]